MYLYDAVYQVVQQPLESVVQSLWGILILMFVAQLFWVIGIHGNQMVKPIREPLLLGAIMVNMTAFEQGKEAPNIITMPFWDVYMSIGGSGLTIGLLTAVMLATRRKEMREIAKLSFGPGIFNINEPLIFGTPIVLNPILIPPFIIAPLVNGVIAWVATSAGLVNKVTVNAPWTLPGPIGAFLATGGDWRAIVLNILLIVLSILIYYPFVKIYDKNELEKENQPVTE